MRSYLIIFSLKFCARDFLKTIGPISTTVPQMLRRNLTLYVIFFFFCRHFRFWFTVDFVFLYDIICAEVISDTIRDMTMKFIRSIDYSVKLCNIKMFYANDVISQSIPGHKKLGTNFESKFPYGLICIFLSFDILSGHT